MLFYKVIFSIVFWNVAGSPNRKMGKYDQLILVQKSPIAAYYEKRKVWPTTNINSTNSGLTKNACQALLNTNRWVARGLWPHRLRGNSPASCMKFVEGYVQSFINSTLRERLEVLWPQFIANKTCESYWEFEWHMHGSCVGDIDSMKTVEMYFVQVLELVDKYNIGSLFEQYKILPGESYSLENIHNLLQYEYEINPRIICMTVKNSEQQEEQYLLEVQLCFNKTLGFENCHYFHSRLCNNSMPVTYAAIQEISRDLNIIE